MRVNKIIFGCLSLIVSQLITGSDSSTVGTVDFFRVGISPLRVNEGTIVSLNSATAVTNAIYDYLIDIDDQNVPMPRLARRWTISDDGLTYKLFLFSDVDFHSGHSLSTADVVWSINRLRNSEELFIYHKYENILTIKEELPNAIVFQLKKPNPFFLYDLADNQAIIMREGEENILNYNGTGPFKLERISEEKGIVLKRNLNYFGKIPNVKKLNFMFITDDRSAKELLINNEVDMIWEVTKADYNKIGKDQRFYQLSAVSNEYDVFWIHSLQKHSEYQQLIKALHKAINCSSIFKKITEGIGGRANNTPVGPYFNNYHVSAAYTRDIREANKHLEELKDEGELKIKLNISSHNNHIVFAQLIKRQLIDININVEIVVKNTLDKTFSENGDNYEFSINSMFSDVNPQIELENMFMTNGLYNKVEFSDTEFDELVSLARFSTEFNNRKDLYLAMQALLFERGPTIICYFLPHMALVKKEFKNIRLKTLLGRTDFTKILLN